MESEGPPACGERTLATSMPKWIGPKRKGQAAAVVKVVAA